MPHPPSRQRVDSTSWQSTTGLPPQASGGAKVSPFKFMTRNVSWDPNVTVVEPRAHPPRPPYAASSGSYKEREPRRPILHPILSPESTHIIFDARLAPAPSMPSSLSHSIAEPATSSGARRLRIVSREFPWTIDIANPDQSAVTCADVFSALYAALSVPITASEWTLADDYKRESMQRANRNRRGGGSVRRLRRVDWLGSRVYFKGLSRDDELGRARLLPQTDLLPETWVAKFGSRS